MELNERMVAELESLYAQGDMVTLEARARALVASHPNVGLAWSILTAALAGQGKDALEAAARTAELLPDDPNALLSLGDALFQSSQFLAARDVYLRAIELAPSFAPLRNNLGNAYKHIGEIKAAEDQFRLALELQPDFFQAAFNLATLLQENGQTEQSEPLLRQVLRNAPDFAPAIVQLGLLAKEKGKLTETVSLFKRVLELAPELPHGVVNLGATHIALGQFEEAKQVLVEARNRFPAVVEVHTNLGEALYRLKRFGEAKSSLVQALALDSNQSSSHRYLGLTQLALGDRENGVRSLRAALALRPNDRQLQSIILFHISQSSSFTAQEAFHEHRAFGLAVESGAAAIEWSRPGVEAADKKLRIGFMSGDMNGHIAGRCLEPILAILSEHDDLELVGYYTSPQGIDQKALSIQGRFDKWRSVSRLADHELAQRIKDDAVDVLFDLSGHTEYNRLEVLALKPAPVQVSWLGYPWTTGLTSVDYYLADSKWLPPGQYDTLFTEKLVYLPAFLPFVSPLDAPDVTSPPSVTKGYFTFGSFNNFQKINGRVIEVWSQILRYVPNSRMLIGALPGDEARAFLVDSFKHHGIDESRLDFAPSLPSEDFMALLNTVDLCLDTFPYSGGTTNYFALWMGVPTISLSGDTPPSRIGAAALNHVGLDSFVVPDCGSYINRAMSITRNLEELALLRHRLRDLCRQSASMDHDLVASAIHRMVRTVWRRHCTGALAESFSVELIPPYRA